MEATGNVRVTLNSVAVDWCVSVVAKGEVQQHDSIALSATLWHPVSGHVQQRHVVNTSVGPNGKSLAHGSSNFHFLVPGQKYRFTLGIEDGKPLLELEPETVRLGQSRLVAMLARVLPSDMWRTYVGDDHDLGQWLSESPEDMMWTTTPASFKLMQSLWVNACFTLPSPESPIMQCPNPKSRYCLDLTKGVPWLKSKKVRRNKSHFCLTVNAQYERTFNACEQTHTMNGRGTWITPDLVAALNRCREEEGELKVYSIELWEKSSGKLAAAIMALSLGDIFHDYTTATFIRDDRSAGAVLTKVVGHLLTECGFTLWYWGFKNPYMAEYDGHYGGLLMDNKTQFWPRWKQARLGLDSEGRPKSPPRPLAELMLSKMDTVVGSEGKLDLACLS